LWQREVALISPELPVIAADPILIYRTTNAIEAKSLAMQLEDAGIETHLTGETLYEAYAGLGLGQTAPVDVWVSSADRDAATPLVDAWREEHHGAGKKAAAPKFQYSMQTLLVTTTIVAIFAWIFAHNGETGAAVIAILLEVLLYLVPPVVYFYRRYYRAEPES
jgi:hypothetical protein